MRSENADIILSEPKISAIEFDDDYSILVSQFTLINSIDEFYINVRRPQHEQGWMLHVSVIPSQMERLLKRILPELCYYNVCFKVIKNKWLHRKLNAGVFGEFKVGKVITIYMENVEMIAELTKRIVDLTSGFVGPQVFTDFKLSDIIYTRYGSFISKVEEDAFGNKVRVIRDGLGNLILDQYYLPPIIPDGIENPFISFSKGAPKAKKLFLIGDKYMPVKLLKSDIKGDVWKGLYFNKYLLPKWCVIKQGRKGMLPDEQGRDVRDRLGWQFIVNNALYKKVATPKIIGHIQDEEQSFIVMGFVKKGRDLIKVIQDKAKETAWFSIPVSIRTELLDYLLEIIEQIATIHKNGFVHRDITGTNFLIDSKGKIHLIDLELICSLTDKKPSPPFGLGTPGYMSPEQEFESAPPGVEDDLYSLGGLMVLLFSGGILPINLVDNDGELLKDKLLLMTGDLQLSFLTVQLLSASRDERPGLKTARDVIKDYLKRIKSSDAVNGLPVNVAFEPLHTIITKGINSLAGDLMCDKSFWFSRIENKYGYDVYPLGDKHIFSGLHRGVGGILWMLGKLKAAGFEVDRCEDKIDACLGIVQSQAINKIDQITPSMYYGSAGLAIVLAQSVESGFISDSKEMRGLIYSCFKHTSSQLNLIYGISGQGLAALYCEKCLGDPTFNDITKAYVDSLLTCQREDGSWLFDTKNNQKGVEKANSFGYGIGGIAYFLLRYGFENRSEAAIHAASKSLNYLLRKKKRSEQFVYWDVSDKEHANSKWWCKGSSGIALAFLKGFEVTGVTEYLDVAESALLAFPKYMVHCKFGQCHGLSGLGEIYLEMYRVTNKVEWIDRARWVADFIISNRKNDGKDKVYWLVEGYDFPTADFMIGNSGVLHFLYRYCVPDNVGFPFIS